MNIAVYFMRARSNLTQSEPAIFVKHWHLMYQDTETVCKFLNLFEENTRKSLKSLTGISIFILILL